MGDRITVYLEGKPVRIYRGLKLKHALLASGCGIYEAALEGSIYLVDENGFRLGLDGTMSDEARVFIRQSSREG